MQRPYGFTVVELLIVIVVVAILAAISIVAYNGVANSAHDTAVKNDLANMAKKITMEHAQEGSYPAGGRTRASVESGSGEGQENLFPEFTFSPSKSSYGAVIPASLAYCTDVHRSEFRIMALSKSGRYFEYTSSGGLVDLGTAWRSLYVHLGLCGGFDFPVSYSYANASSNTAISSWHGWTN